MKILFLVAVMILSNKVMAQSPCGDCLYPKAVSVWGLENNRAVQKEIDRAYDDLIKNGNTNGNRYDMTSLDSARKGNEKAMDLIKFQVAQSYVMKNNVPVYPGQIENKRVWADGKVTQLAADVNKLRRDVELKCPRIRKPDSDPAIKELEDFIETASERSNVKLSQNDPAFIKKLVSINNPDCYKSAIKYADFYGAFTSKMGWVEAKASVSDKGGYAHAEGKSGGGTPAGGKEKVRTR